MVSDRQQLSISDLLEAISDIKQRTSNSTTTHDPLNGSLDIEYPSLELVEPPFQIALVLLFSLTATLSLGGNITVIFILSLGKRSSGDLRAFLINLAISDVTMAVFSIPFTYTLFMLGRWVFAPWFCPVVMAMQHASVIVSVYTLMAIGIDRYKAIIHPFDRRLRKCRNKLIIAGIWVMAGLISAIQLRVSSAEKFKYDGQWHYNCGEHWTSATTSRLYTVFIFLFTFAIPLMGLACTYSAIAWRMWRRSSPGNADPERDLVQLRAKRKVIKMLVTIVVMFSLCWLPLQVFLLMYYFVPGFGSYNNDTARRLYALSFFGCLWLANANSFVNPIAYCFMSDNFRADLRDLIRRLSGQGTPRGFGGGSVRSGSTRTTICLTHHNNSEMMRSFRAKRVSYDFGRKTVDYADYRRSSLAHSFL